MTTKLSSRLASRTRLVALLVAILWGVATHLTAAASTLASDEPPPTAPVLLSPADELVATGISHPPFGIPTLTWEAVPTTTKYNVQISSSAGFADPLVDKTTYATSFTPDFVFADGVYYWRVRAAVGSNEWGAYSAVRSFNKDWSDSGSNVPRLLSPPEDSVRSAFQTDDFSWTPVPGAATYLFEISSDPSFSNVLYDATTLQPHHTPTERLSNNRYYWRVTPTDNENNHGQSSEVHTFTFSWSQPPQPLTPADDADVAFLPRFAWTAVEAARYYQLEISTQPDFGSATTYTTESTEFTPVEALSNDQDYYWRVKAVDYKGHNSPWSTSRQFQIHWNFKAKLLTPTNTAIRRSYPFFSWTPIPGVERYQLQIDESTSFDQPIANMEIYNTTTYAHPGWKTVQIDQDYYWRVRGLDHQNNATPWSNFSSFRVSYETTPNLVYPLPYYQPDSTTLPVHQDRTIAWPLFVWDTAHIFDSETGLTQRPDYYELTVTDDPSFQQVNFQVKTAGLAAAPTVANPFNDLQDGQIYYWRVRAFRNDIQMGTDTIWTTRIDRQTAQLPITDTITLIQPADDFEAVAAPPVLGWLPVEDAHHYQVEVSRDADFNQIVDSAEAQSVYYVPWQDEQEPMPFGAYWWRVRAEDQTGTQIGDWSPTRRFDLSLDLVTGNPFDFVPPSGPSSILGTATNYDPAYSYVASSPDGGWGEYELGDLHVMLDRTYNNNNFNWVIAFQASSSVNTLQYGIYIDSDHVEGSGATSDPLGKPISVDSLYRPEFVIYIDRSGDLVDADQIGFYQWNGDTWAPYRSLSGLGGDAWYSPDTQAVQLLVPYTAISAGDEDFVGSIALHVFSTSLDTSDGMRDSVPVQGAGVDNPAFVSDMLMPLYPFDTPFSNPIVHYDLPPLRWRMPYFDSNDGYQIEVARDPKFTDVVETWETNESKKSPYFGLLPTTFQSEDAYEDNESYYWHVRIRHERYVSTKPEFYDYGPWSPTMRFKLDSRQVGNPTFSTGEVVVGAGLTGEEIAPTTPTFSWDRVEGAAGYTIQIDSDANFSDPVIDEKLDGTSYTPVETMPDGTYYWRVAMRRSSSVIGHWTPTMSFVKRSPWPTPLSPANDQVVNTQPTFQWSAVLTPTTTPRIAAPRYRLQLADDPNFSDPDEYTTDSISYSVEKWESLKDGTWYWRVAILDANNKTGAYSPARQFYKEYLPPELVQPAQGSITQSIPIFEWTPLAGAAYYSIQIDDNPVFSSPNTIHTDNTRYTPTMRLDQNEYYWRVQMYDADRKAGPYELGRVTIQKPRVYLPLLNNE